MQGGNPSVTKDSQDNTLYWRKLFCIAYRNIDMIILPPLARRVILHRRQCKKKQEHKYPAYTYHEIISCRIDSEAQLVTEPRDT